MDMPTVCDCGEIVEYADMIAIGKLLVCEDCYNDHEVENDASQDDSDYFRGVIQDLQKEIRRYRKALEFYADEITYTDKQYTSSGCLVGTGYLNIMSDRGSEARRALGEKK